MILERYSQHPDAQGRKRRYLAQKFGNVEAVQRQFGHKNAAYSLQYSRVTDDELSSALDERG